MDVKGGGSSAAARRSGDKQRGSPPLFSAAASQLHPESLTIRKWWPPSQWGGVRTTKRARLAVCVAAAVSVALAIIVLSTGGWSSSSPLPNEMPWYSFVDDGQGEMNITADHLLDGLLTPEFRYGLCRSRYEFSMYHKKSSHKPSSYLLRKLRKQEELQRRCGPGTAGYKRAMQQLIKSGDGAAATAEADYSNGCRYVVYLSLRGLGNRMLTIASSFLYAVLTERVLLVDASKDITDLFCEPFPGTSWLLPRDGRSSSLTHLDRYDEASPASLGNMLQNGSIVMSAADRSNASWTSSPPSYMLLHLAGGYGFHDKLFYCDTVQELLRDVPWLLMRADGYLVPGLFLTPVFLGELEAMFPEKEAAFYHLGRYLFHPSNAVWHAVTSYHRSYLTSRRRVVGIQIRVYQKKQPPQQVLDQLLSCIRDQKLLLPETAPAGNVNGTSSSSHGNDTAILVTSLSSWYAEQITAEYGGGVHQPSQEGEQRWGDTAHDMRALSEIYLLSMCDVLVTSGFSTFGYVAQGLGGALPWVMSRPSPWDEWTEGQAAPEPPCRRALSVEPCFHSPSYYDCAAGKDVDLDRVTPYIRRCVDVSWGIKLVNESSSSQW